MKTHNSIKPVIAIHPGEILIDELKARGISQTDFARIIGRPVKIVNEIIKGKRNITPKTAFSFSVALDGIDAEFWLGLQRRYDIYCLNQDKDYIEEAANIRNRLELYKSHKNWITA